MEYEVTDILQQANVTAGSYANFPLTQVNDHVIRISVMTEPFYWHLHPNSDESFLVMEGALLIELQGRTIELLPGQLFTIPSGVRHRTRPRGERSVNITFEHMHTETVKG